MQYDVIIVGGGPAGATAATVLAESGITALVLDRAVFPRDKSCGGGLSARILDRFPYFAEAISSVPIHYVDKVFLESPGGRQILTAEEKPLYLMIRRREFDHALLAHAEKRGAIVKQGSKVTSLSVYPDGVEVTTESGDVLRGAVLIGADGVNSTVAVKSGLRSSWPGDRVAIDSMEETPYSELDMKAKDTMYVFYGYDSGYGSGYGYGYVFPKATHLNFGVGYRVDFHRKKVKEHPYQLHGEFLKVLKTRGILRGDSNRSNFLPYLIPVGGPMDKLSAARVLLVGDAAGFVNGFTAEGIYYAMVSGEHAGKVAARAIRERKFDAKFLRQYDQSCFSEVGEELARSQKIQRHLLGRPKIIDKMVRAAQKDKALRKLLTDFGVGRISYREFRQRFLPRAVLIYIRSRLNKVVIGVFRILGGRPSGDRRFD